MADTCSHLSTVVDVTPSSEGMRGLSSDRRPLAAPAGLHDVRPRRLLRRLTEPSRNRALDLEPRSPDHPLLRGW